MGTKLFTFSRSRNLYLTSFDDKLRKDELFGRCEARDSHSFYVVVMEVAKHELTVSTPEASPVQPVAEQPLEMSRRSRRTEGLSDKHSLHGKFGKNVALWRVRNLRFAFSPWCIGGGKAAEAPLCKGSCQRS